MGNQGEAVRVREHGRALILTPPGAAAIAVVRLCGPGVGAFLAAHFSRPAQAGRCVHGVLSDGRRVLDDPVVVLSRDGDVADISLHGGPWVVRSVLQLVRREGFDVTDTPGLPLPHDAVDADREVAEQVLQYLPLARTELAVRALLAQDAAWEAMERSPPDAARAVEMLADRGLYWLLHPPRVAIVGIPNVGKSTLANQLFGQERAITADVAGTTRDWVGEIANVDGLAVMLVDTPGLRQTDDPIEHTAIERSREQVKLADLVVLVLDPTQPFEPDQASLRRAYPDALCVINKSDLGDLAVRGQTVRTVGTTGEGIERLRSRLRDYFLGPMPLALGRPRWWTERQRESLMRIAAAAGERRQARD